MDIDSRQIQPKQDDKVIHMLDDQSIMNMPVAELVRNFNLHVCLIQFHLQKYYATIWIFTMNMKVKGYLTE